MVRGVLQLPHPRFDVLLLLATHIGHPVPVEEDTDTDADGPIWTLFQPVCLRGPLLRCGNLPLFPNHIADVCHGEHVGVVRQLLSATIHMMHSFFSRSNHSCSHNMGLYFIHICKRPLAHPGHGSDILPCKRYRGSHHHMW